MSNCFHRGLGRVVLDTQALLDWRYFRNAHCASWPAPGGNSWRWVATPAMREELAHVLARGFGPSWSTAPESVLTFFDDHAELLDAPMLAAPLSRALRCSDPDDQKFIDLAVAAGASWLISRDHALLKLRRKAWALAGLRVATPAEWRPGAGEQPA